MILKPKELNYMKVKVLRNFRDKYTKKLYKKGQIIDVTNERYEEINSTAHGVLVEKIQEVDFDSMTKKELVEYAKEKGIDLDMSMTKKEMIKELM
jgi:hypothetical protein